MKRFIALIALFLFSVSLLSSTALAAKPQNSGKPGVRTTELVGYDVSYPQCNRNLPTSFYFAVIGINGGTAATENPCLSEQLAWASTAKSGSKQSTKQVYVNTANPGEYISDVTTWPKTAYDLNGNLPPNPYGNPARATMILLAHGSMDGIDQSTQNQCSCQLRSLLASTPTQAITDGGSMWRR